MKSINEYINEAQVNNTKIYLCRANKLSEDGHSYGWPTLIAFTNKSDAQKFKKLFEDTWEENKKNHNAVDPCWMGYGKEIKIEENIVYNNFDNSLLNKAIDEFDINRSH
jgi:hypothetical protein